MEYGHQSMLVEKTFVPSTTNKPRSYDSHVRSRISKPSIKTTVSAKSVRFKVKNVCDSSKFKTNASSLYSQQHNYDIENFTN